ncbi:2'-deoxycytidine 5'-triphosphate deaminase domain-containing protein [candidate division KSB1 bacterium]
MSNEPWKDWIPGVLSENQIVELCENNNIFNVENPKDKIGKEIDNSAIDLHLDDVGYKMIDGAVKPFDISYSDMSYEKYIITKKLAKLCTLDNNKEFHLEAKYTYLFKLKEKLKDLKDSSIFGQATAKSTIGRVDVLARLIVDGMDRYEYFDPSKLAKSTVNLYIEVTPMTFPVIVNEGTSLSQLRLFYGKPENVEIKGEELYETVFNSNEADGSLSVDLDNVKIDDSNEEGCAFYTINNEDPIKLWEREEYDPKKYWQLETKDKKKERLIIEKDKFYIIRSKEKISLPPGIAVYCHATDETIGEMRIHYAGFVHPYFGMKNKGTPLIFEIRGHDVNVSLRDGEKMAILTFYRMSKDSIREEDSYGTQNLKLSNIFKKWY